MACNIHMAHGKHCPLCAHGWQAQALIIAAILVPQLLVSLRMTWTWLFRTMAALALFPFVEGLAALVLGLWDGYWTN